MKVPNQSNYQLSSTTVADTTIKESKNKVYVFSVISKQNIHNYYFCQQQNCRHISSHNLAAMICNKKFQHKWFFVEFPEYASCEKTKTWSLVYSNVKGMFGLLCDIFDTKQHNGFKTWNSTVNSTCLLTQLKVILKVKCIKMHMKRGFLV